LLAEQRDREQYRVHRLEADRELRRECARMSSARSAGEGHSVQPSDSTVSSTASRAPALPRAPPPGSATDTSGEHRTGGEFDTGDEQRSAHHGAVRDPKIATRNAEGPCRS
jgi:hypothetical protein